MYVLFISCTDSKYHAYCFGITLSHKGWKPNEYGTWSAFSTTRKETRTKRNLYCLFETSYCHNHNAWSLKEPYRTLNKVSRTERLLVIGLYPTALYRIHNHGASKDHYIRVLSVHASTIARKCVFRSFPSRREGEGRENGWCRAWRKLEEMDVAL